MADGSAVHEPERKPVDGVSPNTLDRAQHWVEMSVQAGWLCRRIDYERQTTDTVLFSGPRDKELADEFMATHAATNSAPQEPSPQLELGGPEYTEVEALPEVAKPRPKHPAPARRRK